MDVIDYRQAAYEAQRAQASRAELAERIARATRRDGAVELLKGVRLHRSSSPAEPVHSVSEPAFCVIAQGSKEVFLGNERYRYDPDHCLLITANLPLAGHILDASPEQPYLSFRLTLNPVLVSSVMVELGHFAPQSQPNMRAIGVSPLDAGLLDSVVRLVRLLDSPTEARFLAPLVTREIVYRLQLGEQGGRLRHVVVLGGNTHRIAKAIERLRREFDQPLRIDDIARELGMSVSGFHHHFKAATAMTPLQFQKRLRLQEARRLMLGADFDASSAAYRVGYRDPAHFNREYKSLFGLPPMRDVQRLREAAGESAGR